MAKDLVERLMDQREAGEFDRHRKVGVPEWLVLAVAGEVCRLRAVLADVVELGPTMTPGNIVAYVEQCLDDR